MTNQRRMDVISNNLANANTNGFKKDISIAESFPEKLLAKLSRTPERGNILGENNIVYEANGEIHRARTEQGYFMVETSRGRSYIKDIKFTVSDDGYLKTSYKDLDDVNKTDYENYILDRNGNRVQGGAGDIEALLAGMVYNPPSHVVGTMSGGVRYQKNVIDFTQGNIIDTGGKLDFALKGDGFFKVQGGEGETLYTRNGSFTINEGFLTDLDGNRILGQGGEIAIRNNGELIITSSGQILIDEENIGQLDVVNIENKEFLRKRGDNLFYMVEGEDPIEGQFNGEVLQGHLETSNMDSIRGMVEMITLLRDFEANQKIVKMQDEMLEKAATEIGKA